MIIRLAEGPLHTLFGTFREILYYDEQQESIALVTGQVEHGEESFCRVHRVAGKIVRKCPLTARWLVTTDGRGWCLPHAIRGYLPGKTELRQMICFQKCRRASADTT